MQESLFNKLAFWRKSSASAELGLYVCADKIWVYRAATSESEAIATAFPLDNWTQAFSRIAAQTGPARIHIVLSSHYYQLLLVDKPNVELDEMSQALLWSVKDSVTQAVGDIHLDYFESLQQGVYKVNVVVTEKALMGDMVQVAKALGLETLGISIEEMAMTNLFDEPQARLVLSHHKGQELLLTVVRDGQLFMQRRVRGFLQLDTVKAEDMAFGIADNLSLEIQRSMDYFESQLRQAPVASIELLINGASERLAELVGANFNQSVNVLKADSAEATLARLALGEFERGEAQ